MAEKLMASCTSNSGSMSMSLVSQAAALRHDHHGQRRSSASVASCSSSSSSTTRLLRAPPIISPRATPLPHGSGKTARVTCLFGGEKRDAARRALESALGEKKEAFSKWDEEIKKREASGGGGGGGKGRGRGWGSSGGGGGDKSGGDDASSEGSERGFQWGESLEVVYAFVGLAGLYLVLTQGNKMLAFVLNSVLFVSRGLKPRPTPRYAPVQEPGSAEDHVRNKWGSDD